MNLQKAAELSHAEWREMAAKLKQSAETRLFIDGGTFDNICPMDGSVLNKCAAGKQADVDKAVKNAKQNFESGEWSRMAPRKRMAVMYKWAELVDLHGNVTQKRPFIAFKTNPSAAT